MIEYRVFKHNGLWIYHRYNKINAERLYGQDKDENLRKVINFLDHTIYIKGFVPSYLFNNENSLRVTSVIDIKDKLYFFEVNECRFTKFMQSFEKKLTGHSKALIPILSNYQNALAIEVPVWCEDYQLPDGSIKTLTGHIDLLTFEKGKIWIWDYKPNFENVGKENFKACKQIDLYRDLLCSLVGLNVDQINLGWFNQQHEFIIYDLQEVKL